MPPTGSETRHASPGDGLSLPRDRQDGLPVHASDTLLDGGRMALIVHGHETYCLRLTRQGKLILNK